MLMRKNESKCQTTSEYNIQMCSYFYALNDEKNIPTFKLSSSLSARYSKYKKNIKKYSERSSLFGRNKLFIECLYVKQKLEYLLSSYLGNNPYTKKKKKKY